MKGAAVPIGPIHHWRDSKDFFLQITTPYRFALTS
jgi:hypothetical protein